MEMADVRLLLDKNNIILKSPNGLLNVTVASYIDLALRSHQIKAKPENSPNYCREPISEGNLLSFSARSLCLRFVPLHTPIQHRPFGRLTVCFWTIVSHLFISAWHHVDTPCHLFVMGPPPLAQGGATLPSITTQPVKTSCFHL